MLSFREYLSESLKKRIMKQLYQKDPELHWFDMDDTLVHHDPEKGAKVHVNDSKGNRIETLSTSEYNKHVKEGKLNKESGEKYDYGEFVDSKVFSDSAHPIRKMVNHAQRLLDNDHHVHIITARSDMKDHQILLDALKQMGLDTSHSNFHLHRAGNEGQNPTHINKAKTLHRAIKRIESKTGRKIKTVVGYDDHESNVTDIHSVSANEKGETIHDLHKDTKFTGVLVSGRGDKSKVGMKTVYSK